MDAHLLKVKLMLCRYASCFFFVSMWKLNGYTGTKLVEKLFYKQMRILSGEKMILVFYPSSVIDNALIRDPPTESVIQILFLLYFYSH